MLGPAKAVLGLNQKLLADLNSEGMYGDVGEYCQKTRKDTSRILQVFHVNM